MSRFLLLLIVTLVVVPLDQATKLYISSHFRLYESVTVLENFFHISYLRNKGAAFGLLADSAFRIPFFITVAVLAAAGILVYMYQISNRQRLLQAGLSLIFAGALGNLIDRVLYGEVIDFLDFHWYEHHWPAFNVADSAITVGVGLMLIDLFLEERKKKGNEKTEKE
ncbi:MAG: signal peptidase II [Desulfuromonadales bacterium]